MYNQTRSGFEKRSIQTDCQMGWSRRKQVLMILQLRLTWIRYARIIERIIGPTIQPQSRRNTAQRLLGWLTCSKRTLKWHEIQGAVSVDLEEGTIDVNLQLEDDSKDLLASLVEQSSDNSIALVHPTAKRYEPYPYGLIT